MDMSGKAVPEQSPISVEMERLVTTNSCLEEVVARLTNRLASICSPETPSETEETKAETSPECGLHEELRGQRVRICKAVDTLRDIETTLQV